MAYLFNRLNETLDAANGGRRGSDLLQGGPVQQDRETLGGQGNAIASQPSAIIGAGAPQATPAAAGEQPSAVNSEARNKTFAKNKDASIRATGVDDLSGSIAQAQGTLQSKANAYLADGFTPFDSGKVDKAIDSNDEGSRGEVNTFLNAAPPPTPKFDTEYDDKGSALTGFKDEISALQGNEANGGLIALLQKQGAKRQDGNTYTQGEAQLDASFLNRSKGFGEQKNAAIKSLADYTGQIDTAKAQAKVREAGYDKGREAQKEALRKLLGERAGGIQTDANSELARKNAALADDRSFEASKVASGIASDAQAKLSALQTAARANPPSGASKAAYDSQVAALQGVIANPMASVKRSGANYELQDALTDEQVGDYNWLNTVLGKGEKLSRRGDFNTGTKIERDGSLGTRFGEIDKLLAGLANVSAAPVTQTDGTGITGQSSFGSSADRPTPVMNEPKAPSVNPNAGRTAPLEKGEDPFAGSGQPDDGAIVDPGSTDSPERRGEQASGTPATPDAAPKRSGTIDLRPAVKGVGKFLSGGASNAAEGSGNSSQFGQAVGGATFAGGNTPLAPTSAGIGNGLAGVGQGLAGLNLGGTAPTGSRAQRMQSPQYQALSKQSDALLSLVIGTPGAKGLEYWKQMQAVQAQMRAIEGGK